MKISSVFEDRRKRLMQANPDALFLFPSAEHVLRNPDVHFPYRQESNFYYLTGFEEPESFVVLVDGKTHLFVRERNPERELWDGERYGVDRAAKVFGADAAYPSTEWTTRLPELLKSAEKVFYKMGLSEARDRVVIDLLDKFRVGFGRSGRGVLTVSDPWEVLGEMRLFKDSEEIAHLRKAGEISGHAHKTLMEKVRFGWNEAEVEALVDYEFRRNGCRRNGYGSIIAGGKNACCLHYVSNNEELKNGDLLLVDAGGEYEYYTADITRTYPVGKKFSSEQADLYDLVLKAQKTVIDMVKPGVVYESMHQKACEVLVDGLLQLKVIKGSLEENLKSLDFRRYYPHGTGHLLGMDVHDVGLYKIDGASRKLEPGMVFTVEPGLYFQPTDNQAPEKYKGIGIRIEDNILVTKTGYENFTVSAPKERSEIEKLRSG